MRYKTLNLDKWVNFNGHFHFLKKLLNNLKMAVSVKRRSQVTGHRSQVTGHWSFFECCKIKTRKLEFSKTDLLNIKHLLNMFRHAQLNYLFVEVSIALLMAFNPVMALEVILVFLRVVLVVLDVILVVLKV